MGDSSVRPPSSQRHPRPRPSDAASTHVLEAVLVASIMISAVTYVVTFDQPVAPVGGARDDLQQRALDALQILHDTPMDHAMGDSQLSVYVAQCLNDDCDNLSAALDRILPSGAGYAVYVSNGHDTFPVYVRGTPSGEAVAAMQSMEPAWSSTFLMPATDTFGTGDSPMLVYALPIFHTNALTPGGSQLFVRVLGERADGSEYILTGSASTRAFAASDPAAQGVAVHFVDDAGNAMATHNVTQFTVNGNGAETMLPVPMKVRVEETEGGTLREGAELVIHVPRGWNASASQQLNPQWLVQANATDWNGSRSGSDIRALLVGDLSADAQDFVFNATYRGDILDHYAFHARLLRGATASATVLVKADKHSSATPFATPAVHLSVPKPMGAGDPATWTLSAFIPNNDSALLPTQLSELIRVRTVEITEIDGSPIFGSVTPLRAEGGAWEVSGGRDQITWEGDYVLSNTSVLNLTFQVSASGIAGPDEPETFFTPPIGFDGWEGRLVTRSGPGFYRSNVLPASEAYRGYNSTVPANRLSGLYSMTSDGTYRATPLPGRANYSAGYVSPVQDSLYGSYVHVNDRTVPVGGSVGIDTNVQSLLFALAEVGQSAGVTIRIYPPWSGDERVAKHEQSNLDQGLLSGEVTAMALLDLNGDGYPDPIVGTSNGRVFALHALTGQRLQGDAFTVPFGTGGEQTQGLIPRINHLETIRLGGQDYIVATTNALSNGVYVLNSTLDAVWSYEIPNKDTLGVTTDVDVDGDGRLDIVIARTNTETGAKDALVYVLRALAGTDQLVPYPAENPPVLVDSKAFYLAPGHPTGLVGLDAAGPYGDHPGVAFTIQTLYEAGIVITPDNEDPTNTGVELVPSATPRAGLKALDWRGNPTSTLFGAPITQARPYDYDGDGITDLVAGASSGYVLMLNGEVLTQPLYSYVIAGSLSFISGDIRSSAEAYALTEDGQVFYTDDAWTTTYCTACEVYLPTANAVSSNWTNSLWLVGSASGLWRSTSVPLPSVADEENYLQGLEMLPVVPVPTRGGLPYSLLVNVHNFTDVWFREDNGWVVGEQCLLCTGPFMMRTQDGGQDWEVLTTFQDGNGTTIAPDVDLYRVKFIDGVGWALGSGGTVLRSADGATWTKLETGSTKKLNDIGCAPPAYTTCLIVGDEGELLTTTNAAHATPHFTRTTLAASPATLGVPLGDRPLFSVGWLDAERAYVGTRNSILASFDGAATWTTMPLNYIENDGRVVAVAPDGTGWIMGGGAANGRLWALHDYHIESMVTSEVLSGVPPGSKITRVEMERSNVTIGETEAVVEVATNGDNWASMGAFTPQPALDPLADHRNYTLTPVDFTPASSGSDFRFRVRMNTSGEQTIASPFIRELKFNVFHETGRLYIEPDLSTATQFDASESTGAWDTTLRAIRQAYVPEYWVRNVSGEVIDLQTGFDVVGDGRDDVWLGTGGVLSMNSPDYVIYAGTNESRFIQADNRVYLLDGEDGSIEAHSDRLEGNVTAIRLSDRDDDEVPERVLAAVWNATANKSIVYALDPATLTEQWEYTLWGEQATDMEVGRVVGLHNGTYVGTIRGIVGDEGAAHVWNLNATDGDRAWRILPDDRGHYAITFDVPDEWWFGAYVVEVEVEWTELVEVQGIDPEEVARSARFYDHFTVTPPDLLSPPSPIYTVRLLTWMQDWG